MIESVLPVLLLAVVAALLVPFFIKARGQGQLKSCCSNLKNLGTALEMYAADSRGRYPSDLQILAPNYLKNVPTCPAAGTDTYSPSYKSTSGKSDAFTVYCIGEYHQKFGARQDYPQLTSREGLVPGRTGPEEGFLATLFEGLRSILLCPAWGFFVVRVGERPEPMARAKQVEQRHPWLGWLAWAGWLGLCCAFTAAIWIVSLPLWQGALSALISPLLGTLAAEWTVRAGWYAWEKLSPVSHPHVPPISASQNPQLGASLRVPARRVRQQRWLSRVLKLGVPLAFLALMGLAPLVGANPDRDVFWGLAIGALASFPLYLWGQSWAGELFERELELLPGSGVLLEHSRRWGRATVRQLGVLAEVEEVRGDRFRIGHRTFWVDDEKFLEALRVSHEP